jgi:hypothetical protein
MTPPQEEVSRAVTLLKLHPVVVEAVASFGTIPNRLSFLVTGTRGEIIAESVIWGQSINNHADGWYDIGWRFDHAGSHSRAAWRIINDLNSALVTKPAKRVRMGV